MRASRLLSIQMLLQTRGPLPARVIADELEVSLRTLYRDVDRLSAAGVPIYADRGRHGGLRLLPGWQTQLTGLTAAEAQAVFLSGLAGPGGPAADLGLAGQVHDAQLKLLAALPAAWRDDAQRVHARLHLDPIDWYREPDAVPLLAGVAAAVWDERRLAIVYDSWRGEVRREVLPLGLVLKAGHWYLVAAGGDDALPRTYRVANLRRVDALEQHFRRPRGFDLARHWAAAVARFEAEIASASARVLATPAGLRALRYWNAAAARAVAAARPPRRADGRTALRIPVEPGDAAVAPLVRMAPEVEVVAPAALRRAVVQRLAAGLARYRRAPARAKKS